MSPAEAIALAGRLLVRFNGKGAAINLIKWGWSNPALFLFDTLVD